ncbi:MAG: hypothetical protein GW778_06890 [Alphaproteobacteria bacterium]|nr:hypothetical protein [Alphaproteobacteria bacterium]
MKHIYRRGERGSALFFILIGVALFAALGYVVSDMMRGGNTDIIGEERAKLYAGEISDYGRSIRQAVQMLRISNGCKDTEISFENNILATYANPNSPSDEQCNVFSKKGAGSHYISLDPKWLDSNHSSATYYDKIFITGNICILGVGSATDAACNTNGTSDESLILFIPFVKEEICKELAKNSGVLTPNNNIPKEDYATWSISTYFTGSYAEANSISNDSTSGGGDGSNSLFGKMSGCFEGSQSPPTNSFHYYQVLIAR